MHFPAAGISFRSSKGQGKTMNSALVVIDIQNDITKHYREIIDRINTAIERAAAKGMQVVYIRHNNVTPSAKNFLPGSRGAELRADERGICGIHPRERYRYVLYRGRGRHGLREIHLLQHDEGGIHGVRAFRLRYKL